MDGGKFGELSTPIGIHSKSLRINILIKVTVVASFQRLVHGFIDWESSLVPKARIVANLIVSIAKLEIIVLSTGLIDCGVLFH